jgi:hypothetical protein
MRKAVAVVMESCPDCGGKLTGDGYTAPVACEFVDVPTDREVDAPPLFCGADLDIDAAPLFVGSEIELPISDNTNSIVQKG